MADSDFISNDNYSDALLEDNKKGSVKKMQDSYENLGNYNEANMETFVSQYGSDKLVSSPPADEVQQFIMSDAQSKVAAEKHTPNFETTGGTLIDADDLLGSDLNPVGSSGDDASSSATPQNDEAAMQKSASSHQEQPKIATQQKDEEIAKVAKIESGPQSPASPSSSKPCELTGKSTAMEQVTSSTEKTQCGCPFSPGALFDPHRLHPVAEKLVYWRDPKKSGIVFGSVLLLLLSLTYFSLISIVAYVSLAALSASISFRIYKNVLQAVQKSGEGHPYKEYLEMDINAPQDRVHKIVDLLIGHYNSTVNKLRSIFLVEDLVDSLKFGVMLWGMTYIGAWFNGLTLIILAFVMAFSLPKFYETNKTQIDQYLNLVCAQVNDVMTKVRTKIPLLKKEKEQ